MSAFNLSGVVKECWRYHKININDTNEDNGPWGDLCSSVFKMTVTFDQMPMKYVKVFFYDYWAITYRYSIPGDRITISGSPELVRLNTAPKVEREHKCCIALREDKDDEEPLLIEVSILGLADIERENAIKIIQNRNRYDNPPRIRGVCIRGSNAEEKWKLSEQISTFFLGTDELHGRNSPIQHLKRLGLVHEVLEYLIPTWKKEGRVSNSFNTKGSSTSFCIMSVCAYPNCTRSICFQHGWGDDLTYDEYNDVYENKSCSSNSCYNQFCWIHWKDTPNSSLFYQGECDGCRDARLRYDDDNWSFGDESDTEFRYCPQCYPVECPEYCEENLDGSVDVCGRICCSDCRDSHICCGNSHFEHCNICYPYSY